MYSNITPVGGVRVATLYVSSILQLGAGKRNSEHQKHYDKNNFAALYRYVDFRQLKCQYKNPGATCLLLGHQFNSGKLSGLKHVTRVTAGRRL